MDIDSIRTSLQAGWEQQGQDEKQDQPAILHKFMPKYSRYRSSKYGKKKNNQAAKALMVARAAYKIAANELKYAPSKRGYANMTDTTTYVDCLNYRKTNETDGYVSREDLNMRIRSLQIDGILSFPYTADADICVVRMVIIQIYNTNGSQPVLADVFEYADSFAVCSPFKQSETSTWKVLYDQKWVIGPSNVKQALLFRKYIPLNCDLKCYNDTTYADYRDISTNGIFALATTNRPSSATDKPSISYVSTLKWYG